MESLAVKHEKKPTKNQIYNLLLKWYGRSKLKVYTRKNIYPRSMIGRVAMGHNEAEMCNVGLGQFYCHSYLECLLVPCPLSPGHQHPPPPVLLVTNHSDLVLQSTNSKLEAIYCTLNFLSSAWKHSLVH